MLGSAPSCELLPMLYLILNYDILSLVVFN
jgi:hypothetical protein